MLHLASLTQRKTSMSNELLQEIRFELDERNLAHALSAVALVGISSSISAALPSDSTCWWSAREFVLKTAITEAVLFDIADQFLRGIRWVPGIGGRQVTGKEQGIFIAEREIGSNPFISLGESGRESSPFKTFSAHQEPAKHLLAAMQSQLKPPAKAGSWLLQMGTGKSWGFDYRVRSHAYDGGFSSDAEGSGDQDPIYTAIELLSIAAAAFFIVPQGCQLDRDLIEYCAWPEPICLFLAHFAFAGQLDGLAARRYQAAARGRAY